MYPFGPCIDDSDSEEDPTTTGEVTEEAAGPQGEGGVGEAVVEVGEEEEEGSDEEPADLRSVL